MPDTIDGLIRAQADRYGDKPFVIDTDGRISYAELDTVTSDLAAAFVAAGVGKGSRVGLIMPNNVRWVQLALALTRVGAVLVPLSTLLQARELVAQLRLPRCSTWSPCEEFRGHRYLDDVEPHGRHCPHCAKCGQRTTCQQDAGELRRSTRLAETVTPADPMVIMFTSGSSGPPKGVIHSHGNALGAVRSGSPPAVSTPTPGCICRCRSSGWAASAAASCPR